MQHDKSQEEKQIMKKIIVVCLFTLVTIKAAAQGVITLSNLGLEQVTLNGRPVDSNWMVSFALPDGTLIGHSAGILAQGFFSSGPQIMDGMVGEVDLRVAAWSDGNSFGWVGFSDAFSVTLGDMKNPATIPPDFSGVHIVIPEPSTLSLALLGTLTMGIWAKKKPRNTKFS